MSRFIHGKSLGKVLVDRGIVSKNCRGAELHMPLDGAVFVRVEIVVTHDDIKAILEALASLLSPVAVQLDNPPPPPENTLIRKGVG